MPGWSTTVISSPAAASRPGLDMALWMVERELGAELAAVVAREMEATRSSAIWTQPA